MVGYALESVVFMRGKENNMLVYSKPTYTPESRATNWYSYYERSAICAQCGEEIGMQISTKGDEFYFNNCEKAKYKFCPYCGSSLKVLK
jgi:DNA-directed RNA polymerase subunit RPC12/RpoP